jgi:hypothetical protein
MDEKLHMAAANEEDVSLVMIALADKRGNGIEDGAYKTLLMAAAECYGSDITAFKLGNACIGAVVPNMDLDSAISKANEIADNLPADFLGGRELKTGLSSRGGRLVEASRLYTEAEAALRRAESDPDTPLIAFKSNPEKYREYLLKKS